MEHELQKLDEQKTKTIGYFKRKNELETQLKVLSTNISNLRTRLREMNIINSR